MDDDHKGHRPIDGGDIVPPQTGADPDTLTADIESALRRAVQARIESVAKARHIGLRAAAIIVLQELRS